MSWSKSFTVAAICGLAMLGVASDRALADDQKGAPMPASFYALSTSRLNGQPVDLKEYAGKVALVVNTASKCGFTPQYKGLQELYTDLSPRGFVILGFPSNDFGGQEPGTIEEIQTFCKSKYDVTFPVMNKISVKGEQQHKLYEALTGKDGAFPGDVRWNFGKFLIGKNGKAIARFEPTTKPESPELTGAVEKAIAEPAK